MTEPEPIELAPAVVSVTVAPNIRSAVWVFEDEVPLPSTDDRRTVVQVFHTNTEPITLTVREDRTVTFDGPNEDYPADGWRVQWMPFADSILNQPEPEPTDALEGHPLQPKAIEAPLI